MVGTFQALGLLLLTILPGAVFVFSYERHAGAFAGDPNERAVRFVIGTVIVFPVTAVLAAWVYSRVLHVPLDGSDEFTNRLENPLRVSPAWALLPWGYVVVPWAAGYVAGKLTLARRRRSVISEGSPSVPGVAAWDVVFLDPGPKLISAKLRGGQWVAGVFGVDSFASPSASKQKELVLGAGVQVDDAGRIERDNTGTPIILPGAVVLNYADVELMIVERA